MIVSTVWKTEEKVKTSYFMHRLLSVWVELSMLYHINWNYREIALYIYTHTHLYIYVCTHKRCAHTWLFYNENIGCMLNKHIIFLV